MRQVLSARVERKGIRHVLALAATNVLGIQTTSTDKDGIVLGYTSADVLLDRALAMRRLQPLHESLVNMTTAMSQQSGLPGGEATPTQGDFALSIPDDNEIDVQAHSQMSGEESSELLMRHPLLIDIDTRAVRDEIILAAKMHGEGDLIYQWTDLSEEGIKNAKEQFELMRSEGLALGLNERPVSTVEAEISRLYLTTPSNSQDMESEGKSARWWRRLPLTHLINRGQAKSEQVETRGGSPAQEEHAANISSRIVASKLLQGASNRSQAIGDSTGRATALVRSGAQPCYRRALIAAVVGELLLFSYATIFYVSTMGEDMGWWAAPPS